jgi:hypothetical protein
MLRSYGRLSGSVIGAADDPRAYSVITFVPSNSNLMRRRMRRGKYRWLVSNNAETSAYSRYQGDSVTAPTTL